MMDFKEQGQDHQTASRLEQSSLEEDTSATQVKDFPEPLIPTSQVVGVTLQESREGIVLFCVMWLDQLTKFVLKYKLSGSLPLLLGP